MADPQSLKTNLPEYVVTGSQLLSCAPHATITEILGQLTVAASSPLVEKKIPWGVAVLKDDEFFGFITPRLLLQKVITHPQWTILTAQDFFETFVEPLPVAMLTNVYQILDLMCRRQAKYLPVIDDQERWQGLLDYRMLQQSFWQSERLGIFELADVMETEVVSLSSATSLAYGAKVLLSLPVGEAITVLNQSPGTEGEVLGYLSEVEILNALIAGARMTQAIADWLNPDALTVGQDTPFLDIAHQLTLEGHGQVWIVDGQQKLVGVVREQAILDQLDPVALHWKNKVLDRRVFTLERLSLAHEKADKFIYWRSPYRVLLIENGQDDSAILHHLLYPAAAFHATFQVIQVDTTAMAIAHLTDSDYDLLLIDLGLPQGQGFRYFEPLQTYTRKVPVVLLVDDEFQQQELIANCLANGAQSYVAKERCSGRTITETEVVVRSLRHAMEQFRVQEELRQKRQLTGENLELQPQITAQAELVQRLQKTDAQVKQIFEAIADIVLLISPEKWHIQPITSQSAQIPNQIIRPLSISSKIKTNISF